MSRLVILLDLIHFYSVIINYMFVKHFGPIHTGRSGRAIKCFAITWGFVPQAMSMLQFTPQEARADQ